jgi:hypothetical protein
MRKAYLNIDPLGQRNSDVLDAATVVHCKIVIRPGILMMNCPRGTKLGTGDKTGDRGQNLGTNQEKAQSGEQGQNGDNSFRRFSENAKKRICPLK